MIRFVNAYEALYTLFLYLIAGLWGLIIVLLIWIYITTFLDLRNKPNQWL
jgi:hypothetical protein